MHFYFFKSTNTKDVISKISIFSNSIVKATILASKYFAKNNFKGKPILTSI